MNSEFIKKNGNTYIYIFNDCQLVKGFSRSSLCDISRQRIFFISNDYYELTKYFRYRTLGEIAGLFADKSSLFQFYRFLNFLLEEHIASLVDDIECFPKINVYWDHPSPIVNAVIDIRNKLHYISKSIQELSDLQCNYLQIRVFEVIDIETIQYISSLIKGKCFKDVEILIKYWGDGAQENVLRDILLRQRNIRFVVHSAPKYLKNKTDTGIRFTPQVIDGASHCGVINLYAINIPSIQGFMENKLYNSCLNKKISIDENGLIKNCPSMEKHYGNIAGTLLSDVIEQEAFRSVGNINKDQIETCSDCEFRYMCSDCRAYTVETKLHAKPVKCSYNPYKALWE